ncbi:MAG: flagellar motor switch protein FliN [SAR324 cluster bacterium]|nr:flagellar motor switch protein FliN [SAR324 cluster bacterium]
MAENTPATIPDEGADEELYSTFAGRSTANPLSAARSIADDDPDSPYHKIEFIHDVPLRLTVEIGQTDLSVRDVLGLHVGKVIEFNKVVGEPMDISVSGRLMARGEIVVVNERYGVRISEVTRPDESGEISSIDK